ncbi:MAG: dUTP diphosphatase [Selenomonadaceae bacterium]|nr:dUTP diphosphatase [Selenomonadaceae bacterium]MBQ6132032.1 dUTP diphosphatase [Selenomonadaceae bacterium]
MIRGFEILEGYDGIHLPTRKTAFSAGYDLEAAESVRVTDKKISLVPTGLKAFFPADEVLLIYLRSSLAVKHNLFLANGVAVIDADYRGHIILPVVSLCGDFEIKRGMRFAQGIFQKYLTVDGDTIGVGEMRRGRFGSTGDF